MRLLPRNFFLCCVIILFTTDWAYSAELAKCRYALVGRLPIQYHGTGMQLTTEGQINGTPAVMLIDTGAAFTLLTRFGTDKRTLRRDITSRTVTGVGGFTRLYSVPISNFQIGPIKSEYRGGLLAIDEMGSRPDYDVIVGSDIFLATDVEIFLAEKQLKFFLPQNCDNTFLGYWNKNAVAVPLKFKTDDPRPMIEVQLNGVKMMALIDSGAALSLVNLSAAAKAGITSESAGVQRGPELSGAGHKLVKSYRAIFKTFSVGDEIIQNANLQLFDDNGADTFVDVILGDDFLRSHRILFAQSQKMVYLSYVGGAPFHDGKANPWIEQEAKAGNGYAQVNLAMEGMNSNDKEVHAAALAWMDKAVDSNTQPALLYMARLRGRDARYADSMALYEKALTFDPYDMGAQLEIYIMRLKAGLTEQAKPELEHAMAQFRWAPWPAPISDYYLGKITFQDLLDKAASDAANARRRYCEAYRFSGALQDAQGQLEQAKNTAIQAKDYC